MKIGFIQSGAIGDVVIGLPAAKWYVDRGYDVFWPVSSSYIDFFRFAAPYVNFLNVPVELNSFDFLLGYPRKLLSDLQVQDVFTLYVYLGSNGQRYNFGQPDNLPDSLKLDEYKYALTGVPFSEKWNLSIVRNRDAEASILESIAAHLPFSLIHEAPSGRRRNIDQDLLENERSRIVKVSELTPSPLDWLGALEAASVIACEDSIYANLTEQTNLMNKKYLFLRSGCRDTPVFKNGWIFK
jgi:hypothetical protein